MGTATGRTKTAFAQLRAYVRCCFRPNTTADMNAVLAANLDSRRRFMTHTSASSRALAHCPWPFARQQRGLCERAQTPSGARAAATVTRTYSYVA
eukprot:446133-Rhodomonas_salina.1